MDLISVAPVDTGNAPWERLTCDASIHEPAGLALHSLLEFFAHSFLVSNGNLKREWTKRPVKLTGTYR